MFAIVSLLRRVAKNKRVRELKRNPSVRRQVSQHAVSIAKAASLSSDRRLCCSHCRCSCHRGPGETGDSKSLRGTPGAHSARDPGASSVAQPYSETITNDQDADAIGLETPTANDSNIMGRQASQSRLVDGPAFPGSLEAPEADPASDDAAAVIVVLPKRPTLRERGWEVFEDPNSSRLALLMYTIILITILLSCTGFVLETLPQYEGLHAWDIIEDVCVSLFTFELVVRFICAPSRLRFIVDAYNIIDFIAILPFYIQLIAGSDSGGFAVIRVIRLTRVLRIFKLGRYSAGMQVFSLAMLRSGQALGILSLFMIIALVLFSSIMYLLERGTWDEQQQLYIRDNGAPSPFFSIPECFYWCITTLTTVGYGDMYPITSLGKLLAGATMVSGLLILSLPISVIGANFAEVLAEHMEKNKKEKEKADGNEEHTVTDGPRTNQEDPRVRSAGQQSVDVQHPPPYAILASGCTVPCWQGQGVGMGLNGPMLGGALLGGGGGCVGVEQLAPLLMTLQALTRQVEALMQMQGGDGKSAQGEPGCCNCWSPAGAGDGKGSREGSGVDKQGGGQGGGSQGRPPSPGVGASRGPQLGDLLPPALPPMVELGSLHARRDYGDNAQGQGHAHVRTHPLAPAGGDASAMVATPTGPVAVISAVTPSAEAGDIRVAIASPGGDGTPTR